MKSTCAKDRSVGERQCELLCKEIESQMGIFINRRPRNKAPHDSGSSASNPTQTVPPPAREDRAPDREEMSQPPVDASLSAPMPNISGNSLPQASGELHSLFDMPDLTERMLYDYFEQAADQCWGSLDFPNQGQYMPE